MLRLFFLEFLMKKIEIDVNRFKLLYESDLSLQEIADKMGVSLTTLRNKLKLLKWKRSAKTRKIKLNIKKIEELRKIGLSREDIIKKLKISRETLIRFEKENGIYYEDPIRQRAYHDAIKKRLERERLGLKPEPRHLWTHLDNYKNEIQELLLKGIPKIQIARKYNVCCATIYNFILLHNLEAPKIRKLDSCKEKIQKMFNQGISTRRIAEELVCSYQSVERILKELGLKRTLNQIKYKSRSGEQEDLIKKLYFQGVSGKEIAEQTHTHPATIYRVIKRLKLIKNQKWANCSEDKLLEMKASGMSFKQIGAHFNVPSTTVFYRFKNLQKNKKM